MSRSFMVASLLRINYILYGMVIKHLIIIFLLIIYVLIIICFTPIINYLFFIMTTLLKFINIMETHETQESSFLYKYFFT